MKKVSICFYFKKLQNGSLAPRVFSDELRNLPITFSGSTINWSVANKNGVDTFILNVNQNVYEINFLTKFSLAIHEEDYEKLKIASENEAKRIQERVATKLSQ